MKKFLLAALCTAFSLGCLPAFGDSTAWNSKPVLHEVPAAFARESAVFILEREVVDYVVENGTAFILNRHHRIIKLLDDKGIESFNKITVTNSGLEVRGLRARAILPGGKVMEVPREKIMETLSESKQQEFVFAMEGLEKGAEVELEYTVKYEFSLFGMEYFQFSIPVMSAEFELKCPRTLVFETKGYNGFPAATDSLNADTSSPFARIYRASRQHIPALHEEPSSNYYANQMRIEYRVAYLPLSKPDERQFTWNDMARNMYRDCYDFTDKELRLVQKFLKSVHVAASDPELQKIQRIEDELKNSFSISEDVTREQAAFEKILSGKVTTEEGFKRFFAACLTAAGIDHELGVTSNRYIHPVDEAFENWKRMDYYLFYFPKHKMYLAPTAMLSRMPFLPNPFLTNKAIFCKITTLGNTRTALAAVRTLNPLSRAMSSHDMDCRVSFKGSDLVPEVTTTQSLKGYSAMGLREAFLYTPADEQKELIAKITDIATTQEEITSYRVTNTAMNSYYENKPLEIRTTVNAGKLMNKAGSKYLFKIGEVIGRQTEMYQEEQRQTPVEVGYPHGLMRLLTIELPEGYMPVNPEILNRSIIHKDKQDKPVMAFTSAYKLEGNLLTVTVDEYYDVMQLPASEIGDYTKVINAAADFNKLVLVLEKKS